MYNWGWQLLTRYPKNTHCQISTQLESGISCVSNYPHMSLSGDGVSTKIVRWNERMMIKHWIVRYLIFRQTQIRLLNIYIYMCMYIYTYITYNIYIYIYPILSSLMDDFPTTRFRHWRCVSLTAKDVFPASAGDHHRGTCEDGEISVRYLTCIYCILYNHEYKRW